MVSHFLAIRICFWWKQDLSSSQSEQFSEWSSKIVRCSTSSEKWSEFMISYFSVSENLFLVKKVSSPTHS
jgi:hypothetical protein